MIEIGTYFTRFKTRNQRLVDQFRTIKNGWFSDLEKLEIHRQIYRQTHQQTSNTITDTVNTRKLETFNQTLNDNDRKHKDEINVEIIKRIMPEKKTLPFLRIQDNERKFYPYVGRMDEDISKRMQTRQKDFGARYGNVKIKTKKPNR